MAVRRFREHVATHNWFAVSIDVAIVFIGVFLGIQANNWNEARLADKSSRTDRLRLIEDLRNNEADFQGRQSFYRDVRRHALAALEGLSSPPGALGEQFLVNAYQASQVRLRPVRRFTYDELVATGRLAGISDRQVREDAAAYYLVLKAVDAGIDVPAYRDRIRREMPYAVQERIKSRCGEQRRDVQGAAVHSLPASCTTGLDAPMIAAAVARLRAIPGLDRDLTLYITDIDQKLGMYAGTRRRAGKLRESLERSLR